MLSCRSALPTLVAPCAALLLATALPAGAQARSARAIALEIEAYLAPRAARNELAGTVIVARHDSVLFERSYGMANVELAVPVRADTKFRIHSITKQFTATAVQLLAHRGAVRLDSSVRTYLPELPESWRGITVRHLVQHTSGVPQLENVWFESFQQNGAKSEADNLKALAPKIARDTLVAAPGTTWAYNNFGYDLLACVIERASGERFADFVRKNIFAPSGMTDAGFDTRASVGDGMYVASAVVPRLASGYNGAPGSLQVAFPLMFGSAGAGGMYATARDLLRYDRALSAHRVVTAEMERENLTTAFKVNAKAAYGFGWIVRYPSEGVYYLQHSGGNNGYTADYGRYPLDSACIIVVTNRGALNAEDVRKGIQRILFGERYA